MIKLVFVLLVIVAFSTIFGLVGFDIIVNWFNTFFNVLNRPFAMIIDVLTTFAEILFSNYYLGLFLGVLLVSVFFRFLIEKFMGD